MKIDIFDTTVPDYSILDKKSISQKSLPRLGGGVSDAFPAE